MKRRLLITALVLGAIVSGAATTMAVTGQFSSARKAAPTASVAQYVSCKKLVRQHRADERSKASAHRRGERSIRNPRTRQRVRRINRADERREKTRHRFQEKLCRNG